MTHSYAQEAPSADADQITVGEYIDFLASASDHTEALYSEEIASQIEAQPTEDRIDYETAPGVAPEESLQGLTADQLEAYHAWKSEQESRESAPLMMFGGEHFNPKDPNKFPGGSEKNGTDHTTSPSHTSGRETSSDGSGSSSGARGVLNEKHGIEEKDNSTSPSTAESLKRSSSNSDDSNNGMPIPSAPPLDSNDLTRLERRIQEAKADLDHKELLYTYYSKTDDHPYRPYSETWSKDEENYEAAHALYFALLQERFERRGSKTEERLALLEEQVTCLVSPLRKREVYYISHLTCKKAKQKFLDDWNNYHALALERNKLQRTFATPYTPSESDRSSLAALEKRVEATKSDLTQYQATISKFQLKFDSQTEKIIDLNTELDALRKKQGAIPNILGIAFTTKGQQDLDEKNKLKKTVNAAIRAKEAYGQRLENAKLQLSTLKPLLEQHTRNCQTRADLIQFHSEERFLAEESTHFAPYIFQLRLENYLKCIKESSKFQTDASRAWFKLKSLYKDHNIESRDHYHRKMCNESLCDQIRPKEQETEALFKKTLAAAERLVAARLKLLGPQERLKEQERLTLLSQGERDREKLRLTNHLEGDDIHEEGVAFNNHGWEQIHKKALKSVAFSIQFARERQAEDNAILRDKYGSSYNSSTGGYNNANSSFANSAYNNAQWRAQQSYNQQQANQNWLNGAQTTINNMNWNR